MANSVPVEILKKVPVAGQKCAWQYSKIAENARVRTKLGNIARSKFEKSARAPPKYARGNYEGKFAKGMKKCHGGKNTVILPIDLSVY